MKTPEDYMAYVETTDEQVLELIRQVQIDTIDYTVKRCAEEAKVMYDFGHVSYHESDGYEVKKQSILNVADKIKEEL